MVEKEKAHPYVWTFS